MDPNRIRLLNPQLFWDAVGRGSISYSEAGALSWGGPASFPLVESILGGPKPPSTLVYLNAENSSVPPLGNNGSYPKPWLSAAQFLQNANYTYVGPYAKFVGFSVNDCSGSGCIKDRCSKKNKKSKKPSAIWGRLGYSLSGPNAGVKAFFPQDWYNPSEGTYNAAYWSDYIGIEPPWHSRKDWWASIGKLTTTCDFGNTGLKCDVEVAWITSDIGDDDYFAGLNGAALPDFSLELLTVMVGIAVATRWL